VSKLSLQENRFEEITSELDQLEQKIVKIDKTIEGRLNALKV
jgi:peptidoglycan hydrolase CwlO-like protein